MSKCLCSEKKASCQCTLFNHGKNGNCIKCQCSPCCCEVKEFVDKRDIKYSIVIPSMAEECLSLCLEAIRKYTTFEYDLIVVKNAKRGFGYPINRAIRMTKDTDVIIMNDDTIVKEGWLEAIDNEMNDMRSKGIKGMIVPEVRNTKTKFNIPVGYWSVVCIPRETIELVGLLDESMYLYFHDDDYSLRVQLCGLNLVQIPIPHAHLGARTIGANFEDVDVYGTSKPNFEKDRVYFEEKYKWCS